MRFCTICGAPQESNDVVDLLSLQNLFSIDKSVWEANIGATALARIIMKSNPVACRFHFAENQFAKNGELKENAIPSKIPWKELRIQENYLHDHDYFGFGGGGGKCEETKDFGMYKRVLSATKLPPKRVRSNRKLMKNSLAKPSSDEEDESIKDQKILAEFRSSKMTLMDHFDINAHPSVADMIRIGKSMSTRYSAVFWAFENYRSVRQIVCPEWDSCQRIRHYIEEDREQYRSQTVVVDLKRRLEQAYAEHEMRGKPMFVEYVHLIRETIPLPTPLIRQHWKYWRADKNREKKLSMVFLPRPSDSRPLPVPLRPIVPPPYFPRGYQSLPTFARKRPTEPYSPEFLHAKRMSREAEQDRRVSAIIEDELEQLTAEQERELMGAARGGSWTFDEKIDLAKKFGISYLTVLTCYERRGHKFVLSPD
ncbi:unnamed protein product [Caenorhabditis sp. 36 PRJEB53466]|nr:unnamed protein product [Caenorhabditis sp. 36 PRJEB53466]